MLPLRLNGGIKTISHGIAQLKSSESNIAHPSGFFHAWVPTCSSGDRWHVLNCRNASRDLGSHEFQESERQVRFL